MSKETFKYYQSNDKNKPSDQTIKLYLKAKKLNKLQLSILFKSLRQQYLLLLGYDAIDLCINKNKIAEDEILHNQLKKVTIIDEDKINKIDEDFNKSHAYSNLRKFKTRTIAIIQLFSFIIVYYFSRSLMLSLVPVINIELVILIINKKITKKDLEKATNEMNKIRNRQ